MQRLEVSGAVRPIYGSLGIKRLISVKVFCKTVMFLAVMMMKLQSANN